MEKRPASNWTVQGYSKELVQKVAAKVQNLFPRGFWIVGEIQNFAERKNAIFFDLSEAEDPESQASIAVKSTLWRSAFTKIQKSWAFPIY